MEYIYCSFFFIVNSVRKNIFHISYDKLSKSCLHLMWQYLKFDKLNKITYSEQFCYYFSSNYTHIFNCDFLFVRRFFFFNFLCSLSFYLFPGCNFISILENESFFWRMTRTKPLNFIHFSFLFRFINVEMFAYVRVCHYSMPKN